MQLKVIVSSAFLLMPAYADGSYGDKQNLSYPGEEGVTSDSSSPSKWVNLSGNFSLVTDYLYRGQTQTLGGPAAQGGFTLSQNKDDGLYAGIWGSNVSSTTASNGSGLELDLYVGYVYKRDSDLSFRLELRNIRYPGAYASLPTRDKFDTLEILPGITYKFFSLYFAYSFSGNSGVNQNFAPEFSVPLQPNGSSKGSYYTEAQVNIPISFITDNLKFRVTAGYAYVKNYTKLNYAAFSTGLKYKLPENLGGVSIFANVSVTTAHKKYYRVHDSSGKETNIIANKVWFGISKKF